MLIFRASLSSSLRSIQLRTTQILNFSSDDKNVPPSSVSEEIQTESSKRKNSNENPKLSTADKLNKLLASMNTDTDLSLVKKVKIVPQAGGRRQAKEKSKVEKLQKKDEAKSKDILEAVKNVANVTSINEAEKKQTESELLVKLLKHIDGGSPVIPGRTSENQTEHKNLADMTLNDLIIGMKIDREAKPTGTNGTGTMPRSQFVRRNLADKQQQQQQYEARTDSKLPYRKKIQQAIPHTGSVNLFGEEPLGIFNDLSKLNNNEDLMPIWTHLYEKDLKLAITHPPKNYFEKMALWTEQGKIWKFPIDNEQGLETEAEVDFSEHVFMDQHLEGWCPDKGPIRHFMELVCVGLSKNPYITAIEKKEHILWYRDYFEKKKDLLNEVISQQRDTKNELKSVTKGSQGTTNDGHLHISTSHFQGLLFNNLRESRNFLKAQIHSNAGDSNRVKNLTKLGIIKIDNETEHDQLEKEIRFIGHSCTWIPSNKIITKLPENNIEQIENRIVFVGHSCTWLPLAAAPPPQSPATNSRHSNQFSNLTSTDQPSIVRTDLKFDKLNNNEQLKAQQTCTVKSDIETLKEHAEENINNAKISTNPNNILTEIVPNNVSMSIKENCAVKKISELELNSNHKNVSAPARKDEILYSRSSEKQENQMKVQTKIENNNSIDEMSLKEALAMFNLDNSVALSEPAKHKIKVCISPRERNSAELNLSPNQIIQKNQKQKIVSELIGQSDEQLNSHDKENSLNWISPVDNSFADWLEAKEAKSIKRQSKKPIKIVTNTLVIDKKTKKLKFVGANEVTAEQTLKKSTISSTSDSDKENKIVFLGNSCMWMTDSVKKSMLQGNESSDNLINKNLMKNATIDNVNNSKLLNIPKITEVKTENVAQNIDKPRKLHKDKQHTDAKADILVSNNKNSTKSTENAQKSKNNFVTNIPNVEPKIQNENPKKPMQSESVGSQEVDTKSKSAWIENVFKDTTMHSKRSEEKQASNKLTQSKSVETSATVINDTKSTWLENVFKNAKPIHQNIEPKISKHQHSQSQEKASSSSVNTSNYARKSPEVSLTQPTSVISDKMDLEIKKNCSKLNKVPKSTAPSISQTDKISTPVDVPEKNLVFMGHSCTWVPDNVPKNIENSNIIQQFGVAPLPETLIENIEVKEENKPKKKPEFLEVDKQLDALSKIPAKIGKSKFNRTKNKPETQSITKQTDDTKLSSKTAAVSPKIDRTSEIKTEEKKDEENIKISTNVEFKTGRHNVQAELRPKNKIFEHNSIKIEEKESRKVVTPAFTGTELNSHFKTANDEVKNDQINTKTIEFSTKPAESQVPVAQKPQKSVTNDQESKKAKGTSSENLQEIKVTKNLKSNNFNTELNTETVKLKMASVQKTDQFGVKNVEIPINIGEGNKANTLESQKQANKINQQPKKAVQEVQNQLENISSTSTTSDSVLKKLTDRKITVNHTETGFILLDENIAENIKIASHPPIESQSVPQNNNEIQPNPPTSAQKTKIINKTEIGKNAELLTKKNNFNKTVNLIHEHKSKEDSSTSAEQNTAFVLVQNDDNMKHEKIQDKKNIKPVMKHMKKEPTTFSNNQNQNGFVLMNTENMIITKESESKPENKQTENKKPLFSPAEEEIKRLADRINQNTKTPNNSTTINPPQAMKVIENMEFKNPTGASLSTAKARVIVMSDKAFKDLQSTKEALPKISKSISHHTSQKERADVKSSGIASVSTTQQPIKEKDNVQFEATQVEKPAKGFKLTEKELPKTSKSFTIEEPKHFSQQERADVKTSGIASVSTTQQPIKEKDNVQFEATLVEKPSKEFKLTEKELPKTSKKAFSEVSKNNSTSTAAAATNKQPIKEKDDVQYNATKLEKSSKRFQPKKEEVPKTNKPTLEHIHEQQRTEVKPSAPSAATNNQAIITDSVQDKSIKLEKSALNIKELSASMASAEIPINEINKIDEIQVKIDKKIIENNKNAVLETEIKASGNISKPKVPSLEAWRANNVKVSETITTKPRAESVYAVDSIIKQKLEEEAARLGISQAHNKKYSDIPIFNNPRPPSETMQPIRVPPPKLQVQKTFENPTKLKSAINIEADTRPIVKSTNEPLSKDQDNVPIYTAQSPLEKAYRKIDLKIQQIQDELAAEDRKASNIVETSIKPQTAAKLHSKSHSIAPTVNISKEQRPKFREVRNIRDKKLLEENFFKVPSKTIDHEQPAQKNKPYIPFSFAISQSQSKIPDQTTTKPSIDTTSPTSLERNGTMDHYKNYLKSDAAANTAPNEHISIFQQLKNMIKEDLFSYPKEPVKQVNDANNKKDTKSKLSVESCASQTQIDGSIKPESLVKQIKNMVKEDLFTVPQSPPLTTATSTVSSKPNIEAVTLHLQKPVAAIPAIKTNIPEESPINEVSVPQIPVIAKEQNIPLETLTQNTKSFNDPMKITTKFTKLPTQTSKLPETSTESLAAVAKKTNLTIESIKPTPNLKVPDDSAFVESLLAGGKSIPTQLSRKETQLQDYKNETATQPTKIEQLNKSETTVEIGEARPSKWIEMLKKYFKPEKNSSEKQSNQEIIKSRTLFQSWSPPSQQKLNKESAITTDPVKIQHQPSETTEIPSNKSEATNFTLQTQMGVGENTKKLEPVIIAPVETIVSQLNDKQANIVEKENSTNPGNPTPELQSMFQKVSSSFKEKTIDPWSTEPTIKPIALLDHLTNINTEQIKFDNEIKLLAAKIKTPKETYLDKKKIEEAVIPHVNVKARVPDRIKIEENSSSSIKEDKKIQEKNEQVTNKIENTISYKMESKVEEMPTESTAELLKDDTTKFLEMLGATEKSSTVKTEAKSQEKPTKIVPKDDGNIAMKQNVKMTDFETNKSANATVDNIEVKSSINDNPRSKETVKDKTAIKETIIHASPVLQHKLIPTENTTSENNIKIDDKSKEIVENIPESSTVDNNDPKRTSIDVTTTLSKKENGEIEKISSSNEVKTDQKNAESPILNTAQSAQRTNKIAEIKAKHSFKSISDSDLKLDQKAPVTSNQMAPDRLNEAKNMQGTSMAKNEPTLKVNFPKNSNSIKRIEFENGTITVAESQFTDVPRKTPEKTPIIEAETSNSKINHPKFKITKSNLMTDKKEQTTSTDETGNNFEAETKTSSSKTDDANTKSKSLIVNFTALKPDLNNTECIKEISTTTMEIDRYNSFEAATPFNKNEIIVKILCALKLASIKKD